VRHPAAALLASEAVCHRGMRPDCVKQEVSRNNTRVADARAAVCVRPIAADAGLGWRGAPCGRARLPRSRRRLLQCLLAGRASPRCTLLKRTPLTPPSSARPSLHDAPGRHPDASAASGWATISLVQRPKTCLAVQRPKTCARPRTACRSSRTSSCHRASPPSPLRLCPACLCIFVCACVRASVFLSACLCLCARACARVCVRACVRACARFAGVQSKKKSLRMNGWRRMNGDGMEQAARRHASACSMCTACSRVLDSLEHWQPAAFPHLSLGNTHASKHTHARTQYHDKEEHRQKHPRSSALPPPLSVRVVCARVAGARGAGEERRSRADWGGQEGSLGARMMATAETRPDRPRPGTLRACPSLSSSSCCRPR